MQEKNLRYCLWGAGIYGANAAKIFSLCGIPPAFVIDSDSSKRGKEVYDGVICYSSSDMPADK